MPENLWRQDHGSLRVDEDVSHRVIATVQGRDDHGSRGGLRQGDERAHRSGRHTGDRDSGYLIASALGGEATPCGTLSGADTNRHV